MLLELLYSFVFLLSYNISVVIVGIGSTCRGSVTCVGGRLLVILLGGRTMATELFALLSLLLQNLCAIIVGQGLALDEDLSLLSAALLSLLHFCWTRIALTGFCCHCW